MPSDLCFLTPQDSPGCLYYDLMVSNRPFHCDTRVNDIALPNLSKDDLSILAYLRADVIKKLKKCRKSPSSSFTVSPVSPHFAENYFGFFCDSGLWTRCPDARDAVVFYSHYFQAGCVFAALDEVFGTQPPRIANGSIVVGDSGSIASLAPRSVPELSGTSWARRRPASSTPSTLTARFSSSRQH